MTNSAPNRANHISKAFVNNTHFNTHVVHLWENERRQSLIIKLFQKLGFPYDAEKINERLLKAVKEIDPKIVFIIKGTYIWPSTLKKIKNRSECRLVSWSLDDMFAWHNRSIYYTLGLKYYDLVFTTKSYNLIELESLGASCVKFLYQGFSSEEHFPRKYNANHAFDVLFIGSAEKERFDSLKYLAANGIKVTIYGSGWKKRKYKFSHENFCLNPYDLLGSDYADAISSSKISLCFLRKMNRDLHTSRSIEIPACGGFMLAERTREHEQLFRDMEEAVFFDNNYDLLTKIKFYLQNEELRKNIAIKGYQRTRHSDYSYDSMVVQIQNDIENI